ncbi:MAG: SusE domain-containing protein [Bacteroidota bacterium]
MYRLKSVLFCLVGFGLFSCQKELVEVGPTAATIKLEASSYSVSLSQSQAAGAAIHFSWAGFADEEQTGIHYTIEAAIQGSQFSNAVEIGSTNQQSISFTVQEFNEQLRKLVLANTREQIEFRVRANAAQGQPGYSNVVVVAATAYQSYSLYDEAQILRLPGNYEGWNIPSAPRVISAGHNGVYEGFVNFTDPNSQFYLVKGTQWENVTTYNQTGAGTFGFNGTFFFVPGGQGINRVNVNMNTHTWSCTKINSFGLFGTAVSADSKDVDMIFNEATLSWSITKDLTQGEFVFRANQSNAIVFGHNEKSLAGIVDANGEKIRISKAGNYTIMLTLEAPGNYAYGIRRNR